MLKEKSVLWMTSKLPKSCLVTILFFGNQMRPKLHFQKGWGKYGIQFYSFFSFWCIDKKRITIIETDAKNIKILFLCCHFEAWMLTIPAPADDGLWLFIFFIVQTSYFATSSSIVRKPWIFSVTKQSLMFPLRYRQQKKKKQGHY